MRFWHPLLMIIMAAKINISKLLSQISAFGHDANRLAVAVTNETAQGMVTQAQLRVTSNNSIDKGQLRLSIGKTTARVGYNRSFFFANAPYAAYVEFGTGARVSIPKGFELELSKETKPLEVTNTSLSPVNGFNIESSTLIVPI